MMKRACIALCLSALFCHTSHAQFADEFVGQFVTLPTAKAKSMQWSIKMINHGYEVTDQQQQVAAYPATSDEQTELWQKMTWDTTLAKQASCLITQTQAMLCHTPQNATLNTEYFVVDDKLKLTHVTRISTQ